MEENNLIETEAVCNTIDELKYLLLFTRPEQEKNVQETIEHFERKLNSLYI